MSDVQFNNDAPKIAATIDHGINMMLGIVKGTLSDIGGFVKDNWEGFKGAVSNMVPSFGGLFSGATPEGRVKTGDNERGLGQVITKSGPQSQGQSMGISHEISPAMAQSITQFQSSGHGSQNIVALNDSPSRYSAQSIAAPDYFSPMNTPRLAGAGISGGMSV